MPELLNRVATTFKWPTSKDGGWLPTSPRNEGILAHYQRQYDRGLITLNTAHDKACSDIMGNNGYKECKQRWAP